MEVKVIFHNIHNTYNYDGCHHVFPEKRSRHS